MAFTLGTSSQLARARTTPTPIRMTPWQPAVAKPVAQVGVYRGETPAMRAAAATVKRTAPSLQGYRRPAIGVKSAAMPRTSILSGKSIFQGGSPGAYEPTVTQLAQPDYASELAKIRAGEQAKYEAGIAEQKGQIEAAYTARLMTPEQKNRMEAERFEATRATFSGAAREFTEGAYGNVNVGALREGISSLKGQEATAVGRIGYDIGTEEERRRTEAATGKQEQMSRLFSQTEYPRTELPAGLSSQEQLRALTPTAVATPAAVADPYAVNRKNFAMYRSSAHPDYRDPYYSGRGLA